MDKAGQIGAEAWLAAGFRALLRQGASGVQAEILARDLAVPPAAFFTQFPDLATFRAEMLADWTARAYGAVMAGVGAASGPADGLRCLALARISPLAAFEDDAMRAWARADAVVAQALAEMDARLLHVIKALCLAAGASDPDLPLLIRAAALGYAAMARPEGAKAGLDALLRMAAIR